MGGFGGAALSGKVNGHCSAAAEKRDTEDSGAKS